MANKIKRILQSLPFLIIFFGNLINAAEQEKFQSSQSEDAQKREKDIFEEINGFRIRSANEFDFISEISDLTFLKFYFKRSSERSFKIAKYIKNISKRLHDIFAIAMIDCDNFTPRNDKDCVEYEYVKDSFPRLKLLIPTENKWNKLTKNLEKHSEYPWTEKEMTEESIYNYITLNMPFLGIKLKDNNFEQYLNNDYFNKVILFTDKKETQVLWKGLSNYFYDRILFAEVNKDLKEIVDYFNITIFPTVLIYKVKDRKYLVDEPEKLKYEGQFEIKNLLEWIEPHANLENRYTLMKKNLGDPSAEEIGRTLELRKVVKDSYEEYLNKYTDKNILFYFDNKTNRIKPYVKEYMVSTHGFFLSAFFDCSTDKHFCLEKFNVTKFPMLKLLPKFNNQTISNLKERIENIYTFDISKASNVTLADQIREIFPSNLRNISALEFPFCMSESKFRKKFIIAHLYKSSEKNLTMSLLPLDLISRDEKISNYFDFYSVENPLTETIRMYKFLSSSGLFFMYLGEKEQYKIHPVSRDVFYSSLNSIANNFIFYLTHSHIRPDFHSDIVKIIDSNYSLKKNCLENQYCVLAFFDVRPGKDKIESFSRDIGKLENIKASDKRFEQIEFNWVNATCHNYLANLFDVKTDRLPSVVVIYGWRRTYANFSGFWDNFPIINFLERAVTNRLETKNFVKDDIILKNWVCEDVNESVPSLKKPERESKKYLSSKSNENEFDKDEIPNNKVLEISKEISENVNEEQKRSLEETIQEIKYDL